MGYCGFKCESCPALRATKGNDPQALARCAEEWGRLFGSARDLEQLQCDGCYNELGRKADQDCPVRPCCKGRGFVTCAECADYPCPSLAERFVARGEIEARLGEAIDDDIYRTYIRPLENRARLDTIHKRYKK